MKKINLTFITFFLISFSLFIPLAVLAQDYKPLEPGVLEIEEDVAIAFSDYLQQAYKVFFFMIVIISILLLIVGGLEYMLSSIPAVKTSGWSRIIAAISGLVLALSSYLILFTINEDLVNLDFSFNNLNPPEEVPITPGQGATNPSDPTNPTNPPGDGLGEGHYGQVPTNEFQVRATLQAVGITTNDKNTCRENNLSGCRTYVGGLNQAQINGLIDLKTACNCTIVVTGAAEQGGHSAGSQHYDGLAVDIRENTGINNYINNLTDFSRRTNSGLPIADNPGRISGANFILDERNGSQPHWHFQF